ncbi:PQQ-binding-like beta-propeller repeat protein [Cellulosimicrobium cellulans]|uniref:outer membrane protein assembly factor BamB family protein n=1 Tax=Cellulosimicrobium cellulans TaxID=1710 RepID=UPI00130EFD9D|nr:PQQ-binding-like beta-propeller repeat protein [Cellulosimicrobium cellulans]
MAREDAMQEVELAAPAAEGEAGPGGAPAGDAAHRARRRALLRWWPAAVVAVGAVVAVQVVQDARERDRVAAAREVPGVVRYDVGPDLPTTAVDDALVGSVGETGIAAGDLRIAAEPVEFGRPRAVAGADAESGAVTWRTEVETQDDATARPTMQAPVCWGADGGTGPATRVRCLVTDRPATLTGGGGWREDPPTRSRLLTLDAGTGAVLHQRDVAPQTAVVADEELAILGEVAADGAVRVTAEDVASEAVVWSTDLGGIPGADPVYDPRLDLGDERVTVWTGGRVLVLGRADGARLAEGSQIWTGRDGGLLVQDGDPGAVRLAGHDGRGTQIVPALPLGLGVDDGSARGVELFTALVEGDRTLRGVDAATGETLWQAGLDGSADSWPLLLDGVLYGVDATAAWAVDARDGRERWRTARSAGEDGASVGVVSGSSLTPVTDGRNLLLVDQVPGSEPQLVAWSLQTGAELWRTALPPETGGWVHPWDGALYGGAEHPVRIGG